MYFDFWKALEDYNNPRTGQWTTQLVETAENESTLFVSMPGYGRDDITVEINAGQLTIDGKLSEGRCVTDLVPKSIHHSFAVSTAYRVHEAVLENGVLAIKLTRHSAAEPFRIQLK